MRRRYFLVLLLLLITPQYAISNDWYTHGSFPAHGSPATSAGMRAELDAISAGFDKLPGLTGNNNKLVLINSSGSGMTTTDGTLTIPVGFTITGAYALTLALSGTTSLTLPQSGTVSTLAGSETLTNKVVNLASNTLTGTTAQFNTALTDNDFATLAGAEALQNKTSLAIGTTTPTQSQLLLGGTFVPGSGSGGTAVDVRTTITAQVDRDAAGAVILPTLNEAASGTHPWFASLEVNPPVIGAGVADLTNAASLRITGTPTAGTNNYALAVDNGAVKIGGGTVQIDVSGSGGSNPNLHFHDGSNDHYFEVNSGNMRYFTTGDLLLMPGSGEKARLTATGILAVGTSDTNALSAGGLALNHAIRLTEIADPDAPSSNQAVFYARDDGAGKTQLMVRFATGAAQVICTQP